MKLLWLGRFLLCTHSHIVAYYMGDAAASERRKRSDMYEYE